MYRKTFEAEILIVRRRFVFIDTLRTSNYASDLCKRYCNCCQSTLRNNLIQERLQEDV